MSKLEQLEKLLSEATPGKWANELRTRPNEHDKSRQFGMVRNNETNVTGIIQPSDAELICALRNAAPMLLDIVKAAKEVSGYLVCMCNNNHCPKCNLSYVLKKFEESES